MKVVMLGKLRSGKSTVTNFIKEIMSKEFNVNLVSKPLATPIYAEAKDFYARHNLTWRKNRKLLEGIGEALNDDYPNGDKVVELYDEGFNPNEDIVVEDCRRITQANYLKQRGAVLIRINADKDIRKGRCKRGEWSEGHVTDEELTTYPVDFELDNNGDDLQALRAKVYELCLQVNKYGERE